MLPGESPALRASRASDVRVLSDLLEGGRMTRTVELEREDGSVLRLEVHSDETMSWLEDNMLALGFESVILVGEYES